MRRFVLALVLACCAAAPAMPATSPGDLQARVDATPDGGVLRVEGGEWRGPVRIDRPMTLEGTGGATILGDLRSSVVEIEGDGVTLRGFAIRGSGRDTSAEAAGIKVEGSNHRIENNLVDDVYFGIHVGNGHDNVVRDNHIAPGMRTGVRPGHGIYLWYQFGTLVEGNAIRDARDGIYMTNSDGVVVRSNSVTESRYGLHAMNSLSIEFEANDIHDNLLGAALMYTQHVRMRCNRIERQREGATAYGVMLKEIEQLQFERNALVGNRVGMYGDNTPSGAGNVALVRDNLIAGSEAALALQSTVRFTFTGNQVVDNLMVVRSEGAGLSPANRWSHEGRGNFWDDYHGFDRDGDGIGDLPYRYEVVMDDLVRRQPLMRALLYTPAHLAIENAARMFPVIRPDPLINDERPLMRPGRIDCAVRQQ